MYGLQLASCWADNASRCSSRSEESASVATRLRSLATREQGPELGLSRETAEELN